MGDNEPNDVTGTYVFDEDVMEEMENFDSTAVLDEEWVRTAGGDDPDGGLLDDIESSTVVLDSEPKSRKA